MYTFYAYCSRYFKCVNNIQCACCHIHLTCIRYICFSLNCLTDIHSYVYNFFYLTVLQMQFESFVRLHLPEKLPTGYLFFLCCIFWRETANHLSQTHTLQDKSLTFGQDLKGWKFLLLTLQTRNTQGNYVLFVISYLHKTVLKCCLIIYLCQNSKNELFPCITTVYR